VADNYTAELEEMVMAYNTFTSQPIQSVSNLGLLHRREMQVQYCSVISPSSFSMFYLSASDVFCYLCDDMKEDLELASHLSTFGISVQALSKTEKSMTELVSNCSSSQFAHF